MANEISVNVSMQVAKGYLQHQQVPGTISVTMTGTKCAGGAQALSTSDEPIDLNELSASTVGWSYFRNTSTVTGEDIAIGIFQGGTFYPLVGLKPGEVAMFRLNTDVATAQAPYAKAAAGTPVLQYWIAED
jgi:hypothetical protein